MARVGLFAGDSRHIPSPDHSMPTNFPFRTMSIRPGERTGPGLDLIDFQCPLKGPRTRANSLKEAPGSTRCFIQPMS